MADGKSCCQTRVFRRFVDDTVRRFICNSSNTHRLLTAALKVCRIIPTVCWFPGQRSMVNWRCLDPVFLLFQDVLYCLFCHLFTILFNTVSESLRDEILCCTLLMICSHNGHWYVLTVSFNGCHPTGFGWSGSACTRGHEDAEQSDLW